MKRLPYKTVSEPNGSRRDGVSLIELIAVVLIIGIMSAVAVPQYFDAMQQYRAEAAAKRVRSDLELAQRNAKSTSASRKVIYWTLFERYTLFGIKDPDHPGKTFYGIPFYSVDLKNTGYAAVIVSANFGGNAIVTFDRYGRPDSGGTVVIQSGIYQKTIVVDATTGRVTIP